MAQGQPGAAVGSGAQAGGTPRTHHPEGPMRTLTHHTADGDFRTQQPVLIHVLWHHL